MTGSGGAWNIPIGPALAAARGRSSSSRAMVNEAAMNRNKQQNAQNEHAGEKRPSDGKGAKNGGHGSHKATKDAQGGKAAK